MESIICKNLSSVSDRLEVHQLTRASVSPCFPYNGRSFPANRHCYPERVFRVYTYLYTHAYLSSTLKFQIISLSFFIYPSIPVNSLRFTCKMTTNCCYNNLCGYNIYLRRKLMTFNI